MEIVRRTRRGNNANSATVAKTQPTTSASKPKVKAREQAILVDINREDFPALVRKIRGGINLEVIGDRVVGMRKARSGGLQIEVRGEST